MQQGNSRRDEDAGDSVARGAAASLTTNIIAAALVAAVMIWAKPYWLNWIASQVVQTSGQGSTR